MRPIRFMYDSKSDTLVYLDYAQLSQDLRGRLAQIDAHVPPISTGRLLSLGPQYGAEPRAPKGFSKRDFFVYLTTSRYQQHRAKRRRQADAKLAGEGPEPTLKTKRLLLAAATRLPLPPLPAHQPQSWRDYLIAQPADAERCVLLIAVARSLVIKIERNPAWQSPYLADHRRQSDWHKLDELTAHALVLRSVYERLGSPPIGSSAAAEVARLDYARKADQLGVVWDQLLDQVHALDMYQRELVFLAADLRDMEQAERIRDLDTDVADLVRSTGASATTDAIEGHAQQSRAHIDALNELFDHLSTVFRSLD